MKDWIPKLEDSDLQDLFKNREELEDMSLHGKQALSQKLRETCVALQKEKSSYKKAKTRTFLRYFLAAAVLLIVFIPLSFYFSRSMFFVPGIDASFTFISGDILHKKADKSRNSTIDSVVVQGDTIKTEPGTHCRIQIGNTILLQILEQSTVTFNSLNTSSIMITLAAGEIFIKAETTAIAKNVRVKTGNADVELYSCETFIRYKDGEAEVGVRKGRVEISYKDEKNMKIQKLLEEYDTFSIQSNMQGVKGNLPQDIEQRIIEFSTTPLFKTDEEVSYLRISTLQDEMMLILNKNDRYTFLSHIDIKLIPALYHIRLEKDGYKPYTVSHSFAAGELYSLDVMLQESPDTEVQDQSEKENTKKTPDKRLYIRKIHTYTNPDKPENSEILGFALSKEYAVAVTKTSLICFDKRGKFIWQNDYGEKSGYIFLSIPSIINNTLIASSNYALLILDVRTGKETKTVDAPGIINYGHRMVKGENNKLYLPYQESIYTLDLHTFELSSKKVIQFESPSEPIILGAKLYVASYITKEIGLFDLSGKKEKTYLLNNVSISPPLYSEGRIIAGDTSGILYVFSQDLMLITSSTLGSGIISLDKCMDKSFIIFTTDGKLHNVSREDLSIIYTFTIDDNPDPSLYYYKAPFLIYDKVFIGNDSQEIVILDVKSGKKEIIPLFLNSLSCSICAINDILFSGTTKGEIVKLEYK